MGGKGAFGCGCGMGGLEKELEGVWKGRGVGSKVVPDFGNARCLGAARVAKRYNGLFTWVRG